MTFAQTENEVAVLLARKWGEDPQIVQWSGDVRKGKDGSSRETIQKNIIIQITWKSLQIVSCRPPEPGMGPLLELGVCVLARGSVQRVIPNL